MNDEEKLAREIHKLSLLLEEKHLTLVENHDFDFAANVLVGACAVSIGFILATVEKDLREAAFKEMQEYIALHFKTLEENLDLFVAEAKQ